MAQSFTTNDGITLINPGTYVSVDVKSGQGNIAAAGVVTLIGEADEGPDYTAEPDLALNAFTPDQFGAVLAKYGSGRIVDAFRAIVAAANDPAIVGGVSLVRIIKTNPSEKADSIIDRVGFGNYANIEAKRAGSPGNLIKYRSDEAQAENAPAHLSLSYCPHFSPTAINTKIRVNGNDAESDSIVQKTELANFMAQIEDQTKGIAVEGSDEIIPTSGNVGATLSATSPAAGLLQVSLSAGQTFSGNPAVGDTIVIAANGDFSATADSVISAGATRNIGSYVIQSITNTVSSATMTLKLVNAPAGMPLGAASGSITAGMRDLILYKPISIKNYTGMDRQTTVGMTGNFVSTISGPNVVLQAPSAWTAQPKAGDIMRLSSAFAGIAAGFYLVVSSTSTSLTASKLSHGSAGTSGSQNVVVAITQGTQPFLILKPVIDGLGKSLEIKNVVGTLSTVLRQQNGSAAAVDDSFKTSGAEYKNSFTISRGTQSDTFVSGGDVCVSIGCVQDDAKLVIDSTGITASIASAVVWTATYEQFKTLSDLVDFINSQTGWSAQLGSSKFASVAPSKLDRGTYGASSSISAKPARLKKDATDWQTKTSGSGLAVTTLLQQSGMPEKISPDRFLSGGIKAGTTSAQAVAAIDAAERVDTNFIVPLFSQDASDDISAGETDSSSTYSVDAINAYVKAHVIKMSALKMRKNRVAICSKRAPYNDVKEAAGELNSFRCGLTFQDVRSINVRGQIVTFQPWMAAVIAAGMQAAAGYKGIVKKFANVSGVLSPFNDFNEVNPGEVEDALVSGLLVMERVPTGGFRWISDQMTYTVDNNFVYNSLQAVYLADLMTLTLIQLFDRSVVGRSVAEISAAGGLALLESQMFDFLRLRWISPSDDAPKGYKNAVVKISGGVMHISVEVKLAGLIYFVPISLTISQVEQTASQ